MKNHGVTSWAYTYGNMKLNIFNKKPTDMFNDITPGRWIGEDDEEEEKFEEEFESSEPVSEEDDEFEYYRNKFLNLSEEYDEPAPEPEPEPVDDFQEQADAIRAWFERVTYCRQFEYDFGTKSAMVSDEF